MCEEGESVCSWRRKRSYGGGGRNECKQFVMVYIHNGHVHIYIVFMEEKKKRERKRERGVCFYVTCVERRRLPLLCV